MKKALTPSLLILVPAIIFSACGKNKSEEIPHLVAETPEQLMAVTEAAYRKGDQHTILSYSNLSETPDEFVEVLAMVLSMGAGEQNTTTEKKITAWSEFSNPSGIPGNWKGKELEFSHDPLGVISISSKGNGGSNSYNIDLAYYQDDLGYRFCGIKYKN